MGFSIIAKTGIQQEIRIPIAGQEVVQPFTWYTCPAGKRAICKGQVKCNNRGAAAISRFEAAGLRMFQWNTGVFPAGGENYIDTPEALSTAGGGQTALFDLELAAGEILETTQDAGTNANFELFFNVIELPV